MQYYPHKRTTKSTRQRIISTYCSYFVHLACIAIWTASSEFGTYRLCEQRRFRRACASAQSRQNLRYSLIQAVSQEEHSDRKPDPWPLWMSGHAQLKFVMTECSKTQIRLTGPVYLGHLSNLFFHINANVSVLLTSIKVWCKAIDCCVCI